MPSASGVLKTPSSWWRSEASSLTQSASAPASVCTISAPSGSLSASDTACCSAGSAGEAPSTSRKRAASSSTVSPDAKARVATSSLPKTEELGCPSPLLHATPATSASIVGSHTVQRAAAATATTRTDGETYVVRSRAAHVTIKSRGARREEWVSAVCARIYLRFRVPTRAGMPGATQRRSGHVRLSNTHVVHGHPRDPTNSSRQNSRLARGRRQALSGVSVTVCRAEQSCTARRPRPPHHR